MSCRCCCCCNCNNLILALKSTLVALEVTYQSFAFVLYLYGMLYNSNLFFANRFLFSNKRYMLQCVNAVYDPKPPKYDDQFYLVGMLVVNNSKDIKAGAFIVFGQT